MTLTCVTEHIYIRGTSRKTIQPIEMKTCQAFYWYVMVYYTCTISFCWYTMVYYTSKSFLLAYHGISHHTRTRSFLFVNMVYYTCTISFYLHTMVYYASKSFLLAYHGISHHARTRSFLLVTMVYYTSTKFYIGIPLCIIAYYTWISYWIIFILSERQWNMTKSSGT